MADSVYILGEGGGVWKMDLPLPEAIADRLTKGYLHEVNADGSPVGDNGGVSVSAQPIERPAINASKATWVGWAVHEGMTPDDAEAATKTDLIEKFGATSPATVDTETPAAPEATDQVAPEAPTPDDAEAAPAAPAGE
jgi:hypothetical protein